MQEEYEKQLRDNDETKSQALEELTEFYEAKLQEKTGLLEEVLTEAKLCLPPTAWPAGPASEQPKSCGKPYLTSSPNFLSACVPFDLCFMHLFVCRPGDSLSQGALWF